jgi:diadenylate cyclase
MNLPLFNFADFLRAFRSYPWWQVAIEWILIGAVVYWIIGFLRGTRGARLLKGIVVLLIALYLVTVIGDRFLGLHRVQFLYNQALVVAGLVVVVVFQPELRRALMRLGETSIFQRFSPQFHDEIDTIVESAAYLARRKIGGLIALEREIPLGGIAENGVRINADMSAPLLNTIFYPNSALHDLGVVVSGGRIMWANVQFPLAEVGDVDQGLGSRHRAAVGLSQETDAVVVVVSEQTGDISIAERGTLTRKLSPDRLRELLRELMQRRGGDNSSFRAAAAA